MGDYKAENIFIFQCLRPGGCSGLIMMHQDSCLYCGLENQYYDETLKVNPEVDN